MASAPSSLVVVSLLVFSAAGTAAVAPFIGSGLLPPTLLLSVAAFALLRALPALPPAPETSPTASP